MAEIAPALLDQPRLVEQLIALEDELFVPGAGESKADPLLAQPPLSRTHTFSRPLVQPRLERRKRRGPAGTPIFPRKIPVPAVPDRLGLAARPRFTYQGEIGHRQRASGPRVLDAVAIAESVELLDIAQLLSRLPLDPGAQPNLESAMLDLQRARRQGLHRIAPKAHGQYARLVGRRRGEHCTGPDRQRR